MKRVGSFKSRISTLLVVGIIIIYTVQGFGDSTSPRPQTTLQPDIITIDFMKTYKQLERPAVLFPHDRHTRALEILPNDCTTCHPKSDNRLSLYFKRTDMPKKDDLFDLYHLECIRCHTEKTALGKQSGPIECGGCHRKNPVITSSRQPMKLNKSLHFRHVLAQKNKCDSCHHEYDPATQKKYYAKGKEGSCRYCHAEKAEENRISMASASHIGCITCHRKNLMKNKSTGPIDCHGCHDAEAQQKIKKITDPGRIERHQPDAVFVKHSDTEKAPVLTKNLQMPPVAFNHKLHESKNDTCIGCHHKSINACTTCHPQKGIKKGDFVGLEQAMHQPGASMSCNGCHAEHQKDTSCAGCHARIQAKGMETVMATSEKCSKCHIELPYDTIPDADVAADVLSSRSFMTQQIKEQDIPDKVTIKTLSDNYEPVEMPHRQIIHALSENIKDSRLVAYFHKSDQTLCLSCHHNGPLSLKPPRCGTCHDEPFDEREMNKPGLMGAYHIQCMECHKQMDIKKPRECTECHKKK